jgi:hypothetical protein
VVKEDHHRQPLVISLADDTQQYLTLVGLALQDEDEEWEEEEDEEEQNTGHDLEEEDEDEEWEETASHHLSSSQHGSGQSRFFYVSTKDKLRGKRGCWYDKVGNGKEVSGILGRHLQSRGG